MTISWYIDSFRKYFHNEVKIEHGGVNNFFIHRRYFVETNNMTGETKIDVPSFEAITDGKKKYKPEQFPEIF